LSSDALVYRLTGETAHQGLGASLHLEQTSLALELLRLLFSSERLPHTGSSRCDLLLQAIRRSGQTRSSASSVDSSLDLRNDTQPRGHVCCCHVRLHEMLVGSTVSSDGQGEACSLKELLDLKDVCWSAEGPSDFKPWKRA